MEVPTETTTKEGTGTGGGESEIATAVTRSSDPFSVINKKLDMLLSAQGLTFDEGSTDEDTSR